MRATTSNDATKGVWKAVEQEILMLTRQCRYSEAKKLQQLLDESITYDFLTEELALAHCRLTIEMAERMIRDIQSGKFRYHSSSGMC